MAYRPTDRTRARAAAARGRIVAAAPEQLAEGGYASASMAAVARRAGVATGSVYRHFPSKGDLFAEAFRQASQREVDVLVALGHRTMPVRERLSAWVHAFVHRALAEPVRAYALIAEPVDPAVEAERLAFRRAYADLFERALNDGVRRGELPPLDVQLTAAAIVGALAEALVGPLQHRQAGAEPLVAGLQTFVLRSVGIAHVHA